MYTCKRTYESSAFQLIGYSQANQTLLVIFRTGQALEYYQVAPFVFKNLLLSESVGRSYHAGIKGQFPSQKWTEQQTKAFLKAFEKAEREQLIKVSILESEL